jgi:hypothetical protein
MEKVIAANAAPTIIYRRAKNILREREKNCCIRKNTGVRCAPFATPAIF